MCGNWKYAALGECVQLWSFKSAKRGKKWEINMIQNLLVSLECIDTHTHTYCIHIFCTSLFANVVPSLCFLFMNIPWIIIYVNSLKYCSLLNVQAGNVLKKLTHKIRTDFTKSTRKSLNWLEWVRLNCFFFVCIELTNKDGAWFRCIAFSNLIRRYFVKWDQKHHKQTTRGGHACIIYQLVSHTIRKSKQFPCKCRKK